MKLITCGAKSMGGNVGHPCGRAARALTAAGYEYEIEVVEGFKNIPFTRGGGKRDHIVALTGSPDVPVLILDDDTFVAGSHQIVEWAKNHPADSPS